MQSAMPREGHTVVVWVVTHGGTEQVPAGALCPHLTWFQPKGAPSCASPSDPCTEVTPYTWPAASPLCQLWACPLPSRSQRNTFMEQRVWGTCLAGGGMAGDLLASR